MLRGGLPTLDFDLAVLTNKVVEPTAMSTLARHLISSAENVTLHFGSHINLAMMAPSVWLEMKIGIVKNLSPSIIEIIEGICIHGRLPRDEDLFSLERLINPLPERDIKRLLQKKYINQIAKGKYAYTEKAIETFRKKARSKVTENLLQINGKKIRLIGVAPPNDTS